MSLFSVTVRNEQHQRLIFLIDAKDRGQAGDEAIRAARTRWLAFDIQPGTIKVIKTEVRDKVEAGR